MQIERYGPQINYPRSWEINVLLSFVVPLKLFVCEYVG